MSRGISERIANRKGQPKKYLVNLVPGGLCRKGAPEQACPEEIRREKQAEEAGIKHPRLFAWLRAFLLLIDPSGSYANIALHDIGEMSLIVEASQQSDVRG